MIGDAIKSRQGQNHFVVVIFITIGCIAWLLLSDLTPALFLVIWSLCDVKTWAKTFVDVFLTTEFLKAELAHFTKQYLGTGYSIHEL